MRNCSVSPFRPWAGALLGLAALACAHLGFAAIGEESPFPLEKAPAAEFYVDKGVSGLFAQLRSADNVQCGTATEKPANPEQARYSPYVSPDTPADPRRFNLRQIVIKLVEGSAVRLRNGELQQVADVGAVDKEQRLPRSGLSDADVLRDLEAINKLVSNGIALVGRSAPQVDEEDLWRLRRCAQSNLARELPDLDLFYFVHLPESETANAPQILDYLRGLKAVEMAHYQPIPFDAADIPPLTTIDVTPSQGYFRPAPKGIDVDFARNFRAGRGNAVRIADIESGWHLNHEDLPRLGFGFGVNWGSSHGTAVLGELAAEENGFGADGIAPNALIGWSGTTSFDPSNIYFYSVGNALLSAGHALRIGDVALIEQQFVQPLGVGVACSTDTDPCANCNRDFWVAVEEYPYEHAAISNMTGAGAVVVEAAGNGGVAVLPASSADSGAIVVGASDTALAPMCWSNYGPRVDVHGWGMGIGTLGYGGVPSGAGTSIVDPTLRANGTDPDQWYTTSFGGTSGASPIVTGAAALIQSLRADVGQAPLTSVALRNLLVATGTPQGSTLPANSPPSMAGRPAQNIGPLPDLRRAVAGFLPDSARFVSQTAVAGAVVQPGATFAYSAAFANSGGLPWSGAHSLSLAPSSSGQVEFQAAAFSLGAAGAEIMPGDTVQRSFSVKAPSQPGTYQLVSVLRDGSQRHLASSPAQHITVAAFNSPVDNARVRLLSFPQSTLPSGANASPAIVSVEVTNTGTTTWDVSHYSLSLLRNLSLSLPKRAADLSGSVAPGATVILDFEVFCMRPGIGGFSAQMAGPHGAFGQSIGQNLVCG